MGIQTKELTTVYRLFIIKDGKEVHYGGSTRVEYMSELIEDYVRTNGISGDKFSFRVEASVKESWEG